MNIIKPDQLSLCTNHLMLGFRETDLILANATGFIYKSENDFYLITNWHNISGKNPYTNESISEHAGIPDIFLTRFRELNKPETAHSVIIELYEDKEMTKPKWLIHPVYKAKVDVVAIKIEDNLIKNRFLVPINEYDFENKYSVEVADTAFVIGYPFSDSLYGELPIWKKASIASEPTINIDQLPKLLIDTATRSGLSGSPVIWERNAIHGLTKNHSFDSIGRIRGFLGVYSGRIGTDELKAQLGIVWKASVIDEIIKGGVFGDPIT